MIKMILRIQLVLCFGMGLIFLNACRDANNSTKSDAEVKQGRIQFRIGEFKSASGKKVKTLDDVTAIVLEIEDSDNNLVSGISQIPVQKIGSSYVAEPILLGVGDYHIVKFWLIDGNDNDKVIFLTPTEGSPLAGAVSDPLEIDFSIAQDELKNIPIEVVESLNFTAGDFGFPSFNIAAISKFTFKVEAHDDTSGSSVITDANISIANDKGAVLYSGALLAQANTIELWDEFSEYIVTVSKSGFVDLVGSYTSTQLKNYSASSLIIDIKESNRRFIFDVQPQDTSVDKIMKTVVVKIVDENTGLVDTTANMNVSLSLRSDSGIVTLNGGQFVTVQAVNGIATYNNLLVNGSFRGARLVAHQSPVLLSHWTGGSAFADVWPVTLQGKDYAFVGRYGGTGIYVLDVTDPSNVISITSAANWPTAGGGGSDVVDIKVHNNFAYLANDVVGSIYIYDLSDSDPANWSFVTSINTQDDGTVVKLVHNVYLEGDYLYTCNNKTGGGDQVVMVYNISTPSNPIFVTAINCFGRIHDMYVTIEDGKRIMFVNVNDYSSERSGGSFRIFDISGIVGNSVVTPPIMLSLSRTGQSNHSGWYKKIGNKGYYSIVREPWTGGSPEAIGDLQMWEVTDRSKPKWLKTITHQDLYLGVDLHSVHNPVFDAAEDVLYVAWYQAGAYMFDVRDPSNPRLLSFYDTYGGASKWKGCWGVYPFFGRQKVVASDMDNGVFIFDFSGVDIEVGFSDPFNVGSLTATDDVAAKDEDNDVVIDLLANDTGTNLLVQSVSSSNDGLVTNNQDGTITFVPFLDFNGSVVLDYTLMDSNFGADYGTVTITINPVNDQPVAVDDSISVVKNQNVTINVLGNDVDVDQDGLTIGTFTQGSNGVVVQVGEDLKYTPSVDFVGSDTFTYTTTDGVLTSGSATVTVDVTSSLKKSSGFILNAKNLKIQENTSTDHVTKKSKKKAVSISLSSPPESEVTLLISKSNDEISLITTELIFTPKNWSVPQDIQLSGLKNDNLLDNQALIYISVDIENSDISYRDIAVETIEVTILNTDKVSLLVSQQYLNFSNTTGIGEFSVSLSNQPKDQMTIQLNNDNVSEVSLDQTALVFNQENWNVPQKVVASPKAIYDGSYAAMITLSVLSGNFSVNEEYVYITLKNELAKQFDVLISVSDGGTASLLGDVKISVDESIAINFTPEDNYVLEYILVNGSIYSKEVSFSYPYVRSDLKIEGVFVKEELSSFDKALPKIDDINRLNEIALIKPALTNVDALAKELATLSLLSFGKEERKTFALIINDFVGDLKDDLSAINSYYFFYSMNNLIDDAHEAEAIIIGGQTIAIIFNNIDNLFLQQAALSSENLRFSLKLLGKLGDYPAIDGDRLQDVLSKVILNIVKLDISAPLLQSSLVQKSFKIDFSKVAFKAERRSKSFGSIYEGAGLEISSLLLLDNDVAYISVLSIKNMKSKRFNKDIISDIVSIGFYDSHKDKIEDIELSQEHSVTLTVPYQISKALGQKKYHASSTIEVGLFDEESGRWVGNGISDVQFDASNVTVTFKAEKMASYAIILGSGLVHIEDDGHEHE